MEFKAVLITLGFLAGLTILFQWAAAGTSVMSKNDPEYPQSQDPEDTVDRGGECNQAGSCCGAQNCYVKNCNNTGSVNVIVIDAASPLDCSGIFNNVTLGLLITQLGNIVNPNPSGCNTILINKINEIVKGTITNIQCCNTSVKNKASSGNCNFTNNSCTAACQNPSKEVNNCRGGSNSCNSNCCSIETC